MEECNRCKIILDETVEYTCIPHTDVYYCDSCLYQPDRLNDSTREGSDSQNVDENQRSSMKNEEVT